MYHPRFKCQGCGRLYETKEAARQCELNDLVHLMQETPHHASIPHKGNGYSGRTRRRPAE